MIVMKFGGSSLESPQAIRRVCSIVKARQKQHPVVVVSAIGKTTNQLLEMAAEAAKGHGYNARKRLDEIRDTHFRIADELVADTRLDSLTTFFQTCFRELHGVVHELSEDGRILTPALSDSVASFGERLSSQLVAAALQAHRVPATHADAQDFIVTDDRHGAATPQLWQTYARLRRFLPHQAEKSVVVMGGFIGATLDGVITTLGRGGSDLTASLVGAGICAEEIQIWTDVDGMLTCDPRLHDKAYRLNRISYEEATVMAECGAKVLHPATIQPAVRQRIPVVIRNSQYPERPGTSIVSAAGKCANPVKTIAVKQKLTILEMSSKEVPAGPEFLRIVHDFCYRKHLEPALLCCQNDSVFLGLESAQILEELEVEFAGCVQVRLHPNVALLSLVGEGVLHNAGVATRVLSALRGLDPVVVSDAACGLACQLLVRQADMKRSMVLLHREFFGQIDVDAFSPVAPAVLQPKPEPDTMLSFTMRKTAILSSFGLRRNV